MAWYDLSDMPWLGHIEPAGAPALRGAQAGAAIASTWQRSRAMDEEQRQFDVNAALRQQEFEISRKATEASTATRILQNQQTQNMLDDAVPLKAEITTINGLQSPDDIRKYTPSADFKTPQAYTALENYKTKRISDLSATDAERSKDLNLAELNKRYATIPVEGQLAVDELRGDDGKWNYPATMELGQWEKQEQQRKFQQEKDLKAVAPTITAEGKKYSADQSSDWHKYVADTNAQSRTDAATIKSDSDLDKFKLRLENAGDNVLDRAASEWMKEKLIAIRTNKDDNLTPRQKAAAMDNIFQSFADKHSSWHPELKGQSAPASAGAPAAIPVAPQNPSERTTGQTYSTPKGNLKWNGDGWLAE